MSVIITSRLSRDTSKTWYIFEWGKGSGQRMASGIFTYTRPKNLIEKNFNKEALAILETKRAQMILDGQAINSTYIPQHKLKQNFLDYYADFVRDHAKTGNRHLKYSLYAFKDFINKDFISPTEITETLCERFRAYLLQRFNGETPSGYFMRFKRVLKAAKKEGYFKNNPAEDLVAKTGQKKKIKQILTEHEYQKLMQTPCINHEVKKAFVFSLYTGLRWVDIKGLRWENIQKEYVIVHQRKTGVFLELPLHQIATRVLGNPKVEGLAFHLPTQDGANKVLQKWADDAGLQKHITWHCARHSFSVLLQKNGIDIATVAGMLGHTSTKYVHQTYKRYIQESAREAIAKLPLSKL